jgi:hypothetical protein
LVFRKWNTLWFHVLEFPNWSSIHRETEKYTKKLNRLFSCLQHK